MSEPICQVLWCRGRLLKQFRNLPPRYCGAGVQANKQRRNLPPGHCEAGSQAAKVVSEPNSWALWGSGAGCLSGVGTYLQGTMGQVCKLFMRCPSLPPGHCGAGVPAV